MLLDRTLLGAALREGRGRYVADCAAFVHEVDNNTRDLFVSPRSPPCASLVLATMSRCELPGCPASPDAVPLLAVYLTSEAPLPAAALEVSPGRATDKVAGVKRRFCMWAHCCTSGFCFLSHGRLPDGFVTLETHECGHRIVADSDYYCTGHHSTPCKPLQVMHQRKLIFPRPT